MIGTLMLSVLAQAAEPEALKADGPWKLDDVRGCTLSRDFATPEGPLTLGVKPNVSAKGGELVLVVPGRGGRYEVDEGRVVLGERDAYPMVWSRVSKRGGPDGYTLQPSDGFWRALPEATQATFEIGRKRTRLELGSMKGATAALDECRARFAKLAAAKTR